ncbi:MAG: DUF2330 domain-containing protein [Verrucomicrobiales bacterium]|nr:DUF2330 domain-containing protein [Verrucomicrobiales bacterium]
MTGRAQRSGGSTDGTVTVPSDDGGCVRVSGFFRRCTGTGLAVLFLAILILGTGSRALADGKVFPSRAEAVEVRMPDQRALLWWSNGVERLVIESRFIGQGTNFAWVVPLPAVPKVEPATSGLFPTLVWLMRPEVIHAPTPWWLLGLFLGGITWLSLTVHADGRMRAMDWCAAVAAGVGCGAAEQGSMAPVGVVVGGTLVLAVYRARHGRLKPLEGILLILIPPLVAGFFLPALATTKAGGVGVGHSVDVLDRQLAGVFETTTLTGTNPAAIREWLTTRGYQMPVETEPVIAEYLREGWVFVASRVRRDASETNVASLHPLSFTFPAREPVYPLRLTGVGNDRLEVDLFVFGAERAAMDGFRVVECRRTKFPTAESGEDFLGRWAEGLMPMAHEGLQAVAPGSAVVSRLQGTLDGSQMRRDAVIRWQGFAEVRDVRYSWSGAWVSVANWTVNGLCLVLVCLAPLFRGPGGPTRPVVQVACASIALALVVSGVWVATLPVTIVRLQGRYSTEIERERQQWAIRHAIHEGRDVNAPITLNSVREAIRQRFPMHQSWIRFRSPPFPIHEEDSPFNYSLRGRSNGVDLLLYDSLGAAEVIPLPE